MGPGATHNSLMCLAGDDSHSAPYWAENPPYVLGAYNWTNTSAAVYARYACHPHSSQ